MRELFSPLKFALGDFKIGDEIWWFKLVLNKMCMYNFCVGPGHIELVHDTIKEVKDGHLICWDWRKHPEDIWGKTHTQAWENLKNQLGKWGPLD
jgi:hypothetical protein